VSEKILRLLLTDLSTVRIKCLAPGCGVVSEMPVEDLPKNFANGLCPFCGTRLIQAVPPGQGNEFAWLAAAFRGLGALTHLEVQFVVQEKTQP
jgi:hypothetical protein